MKSAVVLGKRLHDKEEKEEEEEEDTPAPLVKRTKPTNQDWHKAITDVVLEEWKAEKMCIDVARIVVDYMVQADVYSGQVPGSARRGFTLFNECQGVHRGENPHLGRLEVDQFDEGWPHGVSRIYSTQVNPPLLISEEYFKHGRRHGPMRQWADNGQLIDEIEFVNGVRHGTAREWSDNGILIFEGHYQDGKLHGQFRRWHGNTGRISFEAHHVNGVLHGQRRHWNVHGYLDDVSTWNYGECRKVDDAPLSPLDQVVVNDKCVGFYKPTQPPIAQ